MWLQTQSPLCERTAVCKNNESMLKNYFSEGRGVIKNEYMEDSPEKMKDT